MPLEHLKVGFEPDFAPLTLLAGKAAKGLIIEIIDKAASIGGVQTEFLPVELPDQDEAVGAGAIDALAFKAIIPERAGIFDFSTPLVVSGAAWFVSDTDLLKDGARPVSGARVATPVRGPLATQITRDFPDVSIVGVDTYEAALNAVARKDAEIAALNYHVGCYLVQRDHARTIRLPAAPYQQIPIGLAVANGRRKTALGAIDRGVAVLRRDGVIADLERQWLSATLS